MSRTTLAPIVRWTVKHERIVAMHIGGMKNKAIAKFVKESDVRVSQILSDPKALQIINTAMLDVRAQMKDRLDDGLADLALTAMKRIAETINFPDFLLGSDEKKHQDLLSLNLCKLVYGNRDAGIEEVPPLDAALSERLIIALEASTAVDELIQEAQFEIVEDE